MSIKTHSNPLIYLLECWGYPFVGMSKPLWASTMQRKSTRNKMYRATIYWPELIRLVFVVLLFICAWALVFLVDLARLSWGVMTAFYTAYTLKSLRTIIPTNHERKSIVKLIFCIKISIIKEYKWAKYIFGWDTAPKSVRCISF